MEISMIVLVVGLIVLLVLSLRIIRDTERFATRFPGGTWRICGPGLVIKWPLLNRGWVRLAPGDEGRVARPDQVTIHGVDLVLAEALPVGQNVRVTGFEGHGPRTRARVEVV